MTARLEERTVVSALAKAVASRPHHPWIISREGSTSFADMNIRSNRIAHGLLDKGMKAGETLLIFMQDHIDYIGLWLATSKAGIIEVPVNTSYRGDILKHVVNDSRARVIVAGREFVERLVAIKSELTYLETIIVHGDESHGEPATDSSWDLTYEFGSLVSGNINDLPAKPKASDLMSVMYTSGTTGPSKGVMVCHGHAYVYADANSEILEIGKDDILYSAGLPMFHVAGKWGLFYASLINQCSVAMPRAFSAKDFWNDCRHFKATQTFLLGAMANFLQRQPAQDDDREHSLRKVIMAPLLADARDFVSRFGVELCCGFGATEFNSVCLCHDATGATDPALVGKPRSDLFEVKVVDDNDEEVGPDVVGEIVARPKQPWLMMLGYWRQPEKTLEAWRNLWFHTGDIGRYDSDGNFFFLDRKKDAIRRRGENISSMEVEGIVSQHPAIQECAVFPVTSEFSEQDVMVAVVTKPGEKLDPVEFIRFIEPKMAYFMVPRYVDVVDALPKTPSGKITKVSLRERGLTPTTWDRETAGIKLNR